MPKEKHPTERVGRKPQINNKTKVLNVFDIIKSKTIAGLKFMKPKNLKKQFLKLSRNAKLSIILGLILLVVGIVAFSLSSNGTGNFANETVNDENNEQTSTTTAKIALIEGTLQTKNDKGEWEDIDVTYEPTEGKSLRTVGATSRSSIELGDSSTVRLDANSEIQFDSLDENRILIKQISGYVYNRVSDSPDRTYILHTEDAQYESLGTAFKTSATGDEQAVEVYHSVVHETSTNEKPGEGQKLTVKSRVSPSSDGKIEKLDIEIVKNDAFIEWNLNLDKQNEAYRDKLGFLKDTDSPEINITSHTEGQTILIEPNAAEGTIEFSGTTEKSASLTAQSKSLSGSQPVAVTVGADGAFKTPVLIAPVGSSVFEFVVKDRTGNTTTKNIRISFQRKSQPVESDAITLSVSVSSTKVNASWAYSGSITAKDGVVLVWSKNKNPTYGGSTSEKIKTGNSASIDLSKFESDETYYFRVCEYNKSTDKCGTYSNEVSLKIP